MRERVLLIITDLPQSMKVFSACFRARARFPKSSRFVFSTSEQAHGVIDAIEAKGAGGPHICGGFLDFSGASTSARRALIGRYREIVSRTEALSSWVITHDSKLSGFREGRQIFGPGAERRWDTLGSPFSREALFHRVMRIFHCALHESGHESRSAQLAERAERLALLGQLSRGIGHEFGNILLKISGRTELALGEPTLERANAHLQIISAAVQRAGLIVRNLQSLSKTAICPEPLDLFSIIEDALGQSLQAAGKRTVQVVKKYGVVPKALVDRRAITQVFANLMLNALEAMPKGGRLELRVARKKAAGSHSGSMVSVCVADSGMGIPPEVYPRIFDFAFTTKGEMGTGLGLSISKHVVEAHGGAIHVETEQGKGTRVTVLLPVA